jgi:hypothetical protein
MVEATVATYIAGKTSLTLGADIAIGEQRFDEGVGVVNVTDYASFDALSRSRIACYVEYNDYKTTKQMAEAISIAINERQGSESGSWAVVGEVETIRYGIDEKRRHVFIVNFTIAYGPELYT